MDLVQDRSLHLLPSSPARCNCATAASQYKWTYLYPYIFHAQYYGSCIYCSFLNAVSIAGRHPNMCMYVCVCLSVSLYASVCMYMERMDMEKSFHKFCFQCGYYHTNINTHTLPPPPLSLSLSPSLFLLRTKTN